MSEARYELKELEERTRELLRLILVEMPRATTRDLACDGGVGDEEGEVWARIEREAKLMRGEA